MLEDFTQRLDAEHQTLIWSHPGMPTDYRNSKGRVHTVLPWRRVDYWQAAHDADLAHDATSRVAEAETLSS